MRKNRLLYFLFLLVFIYPFFLIWQGGDLTDSGYKAWNYYSFFNNLSKGETNSSFFLTNFLGALWQKLFPHGGVISFRVLFSIFIVAIASVTYKILNKGIKNKIILILGIFCGISFGIRYTSIFFSYDIASILFLFLMSYFLLLYFESSSKIYIFISGMILFLSFITRFPNIIFLLFLPLILLYHHIYKLQISSFYLKIKKVIFDYILFCFGFLILYIIFYVILSLNGIWDVYFESFNLWNTHQNSSYTIYNLFMSYYRDCIAFYPHLIVVTCLALFLSILYDNAKNQDENKYFIIFLVLSFASIILIYGTSFSFKSSLKYFVPAFCFLPLFLSIIWKNKFSIPSFVLILVAITQVLGTNTGVFLKLSYGFIALFPLSLSILYDIRVIYFGNLKILTKPIYLAGIFFGLFLSLWSTFGTIYGVDWGLRSRIRCIYPIDHEKMRGILTSKKNANNIKILTTAIDKNITDNNTLFIYGHKPMLYYLTEKEPAVKELWLKNGIVSVSQLFSELEASIFLKKKYPMIVDTKQHVMGEDGQKKLNTFLNKYNFYHVENNQIFTIWRTDIK